jgi:hypothetical protein
MANTAPALDMPASQQNSARVIEKLFDIGLFGFLERKPSQLRVRSLEASVQGHIDLENEISSLRRI